MIGSLHNYNLTTSTTLPWGFDYAPPSQYVIYQRVETSWSSAELLIRQEIESFAKLARLCAEKIRRRFFEGLLIARTMFPVAPALPEAVSFPCPLVRSRGTAPRATR